MIAESFSTDRAYIYLVDYETNSILRYTDNGEKKVFPLDSGLIGLAIKKK